MSTALTLAETKRLFDLPDGLVYLDGNSLGAMPSAAPDRALGVLRDEWAARLIGGWTDCGWYVQPNVVGDRIARFLGAPEGSVTMGDTLTLKVHQALTAALALNPDRRVILSDAGNFPSDLYMARAVARTSGEGACGGDTAARRRGLPDRSRRGGAPADRGGLSHRPAARHGGADRAGA